MNRLRLLLSFGLILVISLLVSCGVSSPVVDPTATPEPLKSASEVPRISAEELKDRLDNGEAILVVDTRSKSSFERRHIAGAMSVPASDLVSRLDELPRNQEIVFYCS